VEQSWSSTVSSHMQHALNGLYILKLQNDGPL
jgi:hypothetical protein